MPKKGHTCCVLGCTVNSKKTVMADGRRPRFFCFPHEKKRPHLRRAWLALTRRTEASTNTRVCEFHFVDGKPSTVNPHPILNMGMEATKMQKRAMELRQQKALRKMMMQQQQMIAAGQLVPGQEVPGGQLVGQDPSGVISLSQAQLQQMEEGSSQDQDGFKLPNLDNPYEDTLNLASMGLVDIDDQMPSQIPVSYSNSVPLMMRSRDQCNEGDESLMSNGSLARELQAEEGNDEEDETVNQSDPLSEDMDQVSQPSVSDVLPDDCSKITPLNVNSEDPIPADPSSEATSSSTDGLYPTSLFAVGEEDNDSGLHFVRPLAKPDAAGKKPSGDTEVNRPSDFIATSTPQKQNGPSGQMTKNNAFPMVRNQMSIQQTNKSTPLKVPSWQVRVNGTASVPSALDVPTPPVAKKPRKRKSKPAVKFTFNKPQVSTGISVTYPLVTNSIQTVPKQVTQSGTVMSRQAVESLKSDILENLRAEFLTEMQQEAESNKQLKIEMETVRMQTRQELAQMRVELHALWGENQRLRAQVESLLQDRETNSVKLEN